MRVRFIVRWFKMRFVTISLPLFLIANSVGYAQPSRGAFAHGALVFKDVSVIPMTSETVLRGRTVLVRDGRIVAIDEGVGKEIPSDARQIDGRGKYLIPGLADMHVHLFCDEGAPMSGAVDELGVMIANGVTTIRLMIGTPHHLLLRREIERGGMLGPQLWVASPQFTGKKSANARVVTTPEEAYSAV